MTTTRTQSVQRTTVSFPDAAVTAFDLPRPQTVPAEPAYAENSDHVVREPALREFEAGHVVVDFAATLAVADVFLDRVEVRKLLPTPQKGVTGPSGAFFPTGAATDESLVRTLIDRGEANDLLLSDEAVADFFGQTKSPNTVRSYPGVTLRAGEFLRIYISNQSGGALADQAITGTYKLGLNQRDTGKP